MSHMCIWTMNIPSPIALDLCSRRMRCDSTLLVQGASDQTCLSQSPITWLVHMCECANSRNGMKAARSTLPTHLHELYWACYVCHKPSPDCDLANRSLPRMSMKLCD